MNQADKIIIFFFLYMSINKALFIGINYIGSQYSLRGCINDVNNIYSMIDNMQIDIINKVVLTDDNNNCMPTFENIITSLNWLVSGCEPGDNLFFHYSGHGTQQYSFDDQSEVYDQCICPCDFMMTGYISDDQIFSIISNIPEGVRLTMIFDCCHSGTICDLQYMYKEKNSFIVDHPNNEILGDILMISGCKDNQTSADVSNVSELINEIDCASSLSGGAITSSLVGIFQDFQHLSVSELKKLLLYIMKQQGFTQRPCITSSKKFNATEKDFSLIGLLNWEFQDV